MSNLARAISLASLLFEGQTDKGGQPYVLHCLRVMQSVGTDPELQTIAVLHDVLEDTTLTAADLFKHGFSDRVLAGVERLTKPPGVPYETYLYRITENPDAVKVKLADLTDNINILRLTELTDRDFDRLKKYHRAFRFLTDFNQ